MNLGKFLNLLLENNIINYYILFDFVDELLENINIDIIVLEQSKCITNIENAISNYVSI